MQRRAEKLTTPLLEDTVLNDWFKPMVNALEKVRYADRVFKSLPMLSFILLGCLRQLSSIPTLREQIQTLFHLDTRTEEMPVARATYSDALASSGRRDILRQALPHLVQHAQAILPDKLSCLDGLGQRPVCAIDATYQTESSRYFRVLPKEGGNDNQKGHMLLTYYDLRKGVPVHVTTETASMGEMRVCKEVTPTAFDWAGVRHGIFVVDRAFIDGRHWDQKKTNYNITVITRLKSTLKYKIINTREVTTAICNEAVLSDSEIQLKSSKQPWRLIQWRSPEGIVYEYISNDFSLAPGVIAFLYYRRWDEEKYFDNFKNDLAGSKACGKSPVAIEQQALFGLVTYLLTRLFLQDRYAELALSGESTQERKHRIKQAAYVCEGVGDAYRAFYTGLSKITRQVWRFLKNCFRAKSSRTLYETQLKPMLTGYL